MTIGAAMTDPLALASALLALGLLAAFKMLWRQRKRPPQDNSEGCLMLLAVALIVAGVAVAILKGAG